MSAFNPNVRRQRDWTRKVRRRLDQRSRSKPIASSESGKEAAMLRAALDEGPPPLRPELNAPDVAKRVDRRAKRARRHEAVKAMLAKAGVVAKDESTP